MAGSESGGETIVNCKKVRNVPSSCSRTSLLAKIAMHYDCINGTRYFLLDEMVYGWSGGEIVTWDIEKMCTLDMASSKVIISDV